MSMILQRCAWAQGSQLYMDYHDREWGVPIHDERTLFEFLVLEGAQAGLSWSTILGKRQAYRDAFDGFDAEQVARYDDRKYQGLLANAAIVRNQQKIQAAIHNARCVLQVRDTFGSFDAFIWQFVGGRPIQNAWRSLPEIPASSAESVAMSRTLRARGFKFVGETICYAFMQAVGMVNDHMVDCFRWEAVRDMASKEARP